MKPLYYFLLLLLVIPLYYLNIIIALIYSLTIVSTFLYFRNPQNTMCYWAESVGLTKNASNSYVGSVSGIKVKLTQIQDAYSFDWVNGFGDIRLGRMNSYDYLIMLPRKLNTQAIITNRHRPFSFNDQVACPAFEKSNLVLRINSIPEKAAKLMVDFPYRHLDPLARSPVFVITDEGLIFGQFRHSQKHLLKEVIIELDKIAHALT